MYNLTENNNIKKINVNNNIKINLQRVGKTLVNSPVELNFNTPSINKLKMKLENPSSANPLTNSIKKYPFPLIGKSHILIKDKGNLPGHGLWCQDLSKVQPYDRDAVLDIMKSDIYSKNNLSELITGDADKKTIEILKYKVSDLVTKLEEALCKYYDSEYRTQRAEILREDYYEIIEKKIAENKEIYDTIEPLNVQIESLTEALSNTRKEIERFDIENRNLNQQITQKIKEIEDLNSKNEKLKKKNSELESDNEKIKQKLNEMDERIEIQQLSLDRYQSKVSEKKDYYTPVKETKNPTSINEQKFKDQSEEILKMQLQIVDLKKRLSEDEKIRLNLFEVIKAKKMKNKILKNEVNKIVSIFEESGKENKWSHDLILQKDTIIKVLKEKIGNLSIEVKSQNKQLLKYKKPIMEDKSVETDETKIDNYLHVRASPNLFIDKLKKF